MLLFVHEARGYKETFMPGGHVLGVAVHVRRRNQIRNHIIGCSLPLLSIGAGPLVFSFFFILYIVYIYRMMYRHLPLNDLCAWRYLGQG